MLKPLSFSVRQTESIKAVLFVHGFGGEAHQTFGMLPAFLAGSIDLIGWDIHCFGYPSKLAPDITGFWAADPALLTLSQYFADLLKDGLYSQYQELTLIAHSMGGLIVQRALLDSDLDARVRQVLLFGTPSNGLQKARLGKLFKRQVRDMASGSSFITQLREGWITKYPGALPFDFRVVAGIQDEFVPMDSSVDIFNAEYRNYVPGNHLEMVKPTRSDDEVVVLIRTALLKLFPVAGNSFPSTSQVDNYRQIVNKFEKLEEFLPSEVEEYAFALEMTGFQERAIALLERHHVGNNNLTGVLAGRLKRDWLANPQEMENEGYRSYELYNQAFEDATRQLDFYQAFYNGINVAFLQLALKHSRYDARNTAIRVLEQCCLAPREKWRLATEGEAQMYIGEYEYALDCYTAALQEEPNPREVASMYKQAVWVVRLLEQDGVERKLEHLFAPYVAN